MINCGKNTHFWDGWPYPIWQGLDQGIIFEQVAMISECDVIIKI